MASSKTTTETVDCSDNPLDLRPAADRLESLIRQQVTKNPGQPLIVMMGENHTMPTHVALQQLLMQRLSDPKNNPLRVAVGVEWPHNMVNEVLGEPKSGRDPIPVNIRNHIADGRTPDKQFLRAYHAVLTQHRAPLAHRNLMTWADRHNISVRPVDAAWKPDMETIDGSDKLTKKIIDENYPRLGEPIKFDASDETKNVRYMRVRNLAVRDRVQAHIADTKAQVYFLPYGDSHFLGSKPVPGVSVDHPYKDSFHKLFDDAGLRTLPVFVNDKENLSAGAEMALKQGVVVRGLSSDGFKNQSSLQSENDFLHKINAQSGNSLRLYADSGTKASFLYAPSYWPDSAKSLIPSSRPNSRPKMINSPNLAEHVEKKKHSGHHRRKTPNTDFSRG